MTKYTNKIVKEICELLERGLTQKDVSRLVGINEDTFYDWKKSHPEFSESVEKALIEAKKEMVDLVRTAAKKTWTAAAWWLERKHKDEFSLRQEHTGRDGKELNQVTVFQIPSNNRDVEPEG